MYTVIRRSAVKPGTLPEYIRRINEIFVPIIRAQKGFIAYSVLDLGNDQFATISTFSDREAAENSTKLARNFGEKNGAGILVGSLDVATGEVRGEAHVNLPAIGLGAQPSAEARPH